MAADNSRLLCWKGLWRFYKVILLLLFLDEVNGKQGTLLLLVIEFTTGYWLPFCFQVINVLDEADLVLSDVKEREAGKW